MKITSVLNTVPSPLATLARLTGLRRVDDNSGVTVHRFGRYLRTLVIFMNGKDLDRVVEP